jgi:hypothetical protein
MPAYAQAGYYLGFIYKNLFGPSKKPPFITFPV